MICVPAVNTHNRVAYNLGFVEKPCVPADVLRLSEKTVLAGLSLDFVEVVILRFSGYYCRARGFSTDSSHPPGRDKNHRNEHLWDRLKTSDATAYGPFVNRPQNRNPDCRFPIVILAYSCFLRRFDCLYCPGRRIKYERSDQD